MKIKGTLRDVSPREQVGARTGDAYEYQYCKAAMSCIALLDNQNHLCIFCEWHDDYVIEFEDGDGGIYVFHQVKARGLKQGIWGIVDFFGVIKGPRKVKKDGSSKPPVDQDSIFNRLIDHYFKFGENCKEFVFVTNHAIDDELAKFLKEVHSLGLKDSFKHSAEIYLRIRDAYLQQYGTVLSEESFREILKKTRIEHEAGDFGRHAAELKSELESRIYELSEVSLHHVEATRIADDLLKKVRSKSHVVLDRLPSADEVLRKEKAITPDEVLALLPLSKDGYQILLKSGNSRREAILQSSRLKRLCEANEISADLVTLICECKARWDSWYAEKKYDFNPDDYLTLKIDCGGILQRLSNGTRSDWNLIKMDAEEVSRRFNGAVTESLKLSGMLVLGMVFSLAAQRGPTI
ncbi:MAG TPA: dsDNA nuclease domain-containing protein [Oligoflexus sp.]|uniref:dsDNA nuclease domain-containing protein n=1 Tax=Oligoflexus sp. TaxID=1971216 RepID=UPI002D3B90D9|nr:dsDNA nuclease domain-containing protein [Oligoflexus sp.]HYX32753.1 dsDNA nuclease domain-containing protein [Oligoflexus sp.]